MGFHQSETVFLATPSSLATLSCVFFLASSARSLFATSRIPRPVFAAVDAAAGMLGSLMDR